ncbi:MAG TPA: alpha-L-fucosidase [Gemmatimonadales bacterium]|nr:alpha-L-fucosidase [Gemmatimonadales bacterium]
MTTRRELLIAVSALPLTRLPRLAAARGRAALGARPLPTPSQLEWQRDELAMFLHFGVNTFTGREWGDGRESPAIFAPTALDCRQWARTAKRAGFKTMVLTAKHHDGFCLWPTRTTRHSVASSGWKGGQGDVVREFVDACRAEGLKPGLYCSPWDRNAPAYGDSPRYNAMYWDQLTELLTNYGPIHEVWFDGANGEGPNGRRQVYDWPATFALVRRLQPQAVMFSDAGPDIRWIGNESGSAGDPNWSTIDPAAVPYPGVDAPGVIEALQHGHPDGTVWRPGETDTSIRPGWFYRPEEDGRVRTPDELVELYFTSVGRNSKLLLNVPPTREGLLHPTDVANLLEMCRRLDERFANDLTAGRHPTWRLIGDRGAELSVDLGRVVTVGMADLREEIERGQVVARYSLEGNDGTRWRALSTGATIGCRKLDRFSPARVRRIRLRIDDALDTPAPIRLGLYAP